MNKSINISPIGGVGQIGSNMTLVQTGKDSIIIDSGILFPFENFFGINYLIPDLSELPFITDIVITHGHEDHIGAIKHIVEKFPEITIWATIFTSKLIERKIGRRKINIYDAKSTLAFAEFNIHPIHVNHSIPETNGMLLTFNQIDTCLFFISDFKIDLSGLYEKPFDFKRLKEISGKYSYRYILADSTNILSKKLKTPAEGDLLPAINQVFEETPGRIFVTTFSSNLHRVQSFIDIAKKFDRKVVFYGRSMETYTDIAEKLGIIKIPPFTLKSINDIPVNSKKDENLVVFASGCQGDFRSALKRIATGTDKHFKIRSGDSVIFSSKAIPGNEKQISMLMNSICEMKGRVVSDATHLVHASGHPGKEDLQLIYNEYDPTHIIPIHGESVFLDAHIKFIKEVRPKSKAILLYNFDKIQLEEDGKFNILKSPAKDPIIFHGNGLVLSKDAIRDRRKLATTGCVFVSIEKLNNIQVSLLGLPETMNDQDKKIINFIKKEIKLATPKEDLKERLRISIRQFLFRLIGYKPVVNVHVLN